MRRSLKNAAPGWALPLALLMLGTVAVFLAAGPSSPSSTPGSFRASDAGFAAAPDTPAAVIAREATPAVPGLDVAADSIRSPGPEIVLADSPRRDDARRSILIETRMSEKLRPFRESLTLP